MAFDYTKIETVLNDIDSNYSGWKAEPANKYQYDNLRNDFILLSNENTCEEIIKKLEDKQFCRMKCYSLKISIEELENYFHLFCKHNENYEIIYGNVNHDEISKIYDLNLQSLHEKLIFNLIYTDSGVCNDPRHRF